jgi:hypothetical protein
MNPTSFKYTFPISKAERRADGLYITGEASGPEVDATMERMAPEAITRFAAQIRLMADAGTPLQYRDAHAADGVFRDLGDITNAWIDERFHLGIEVKLDEDSAAATYLFRQLEKGKQFGMSIAGSVLDFIDEFSAEVGRTVRTYKDVVLAEISNTTRPAWTPSLGTVLSKAIDDAAAESLAKTGENVKPEKDTLVAADETVADETAKADAEAATEDETTEKAVETTEDEAETAKSDDTDTDAEAVADATEKSADADADEAPAADVTEKATEEDADIEKAGRTISAATGKRLLALHSEMTQLLLDNGVLQAPDAPAKSDSTDAETDLTKSLTVEKAALEAKVVELTQSLTEKTARITELENTPAVVAPALIERGAPTADEAMEAISKMSPFDRLRTGLTLAHSE